MTSDSRPVDFSDFPSFDPNNGRPDSTILLVVSKNGPVLYPVPHFFRSIHHLTFLPICSAPKIEEGKITYDCVFWDTLMYPIISCNNKGF